MPELSTIEPVTVVSVRTLRPATPPPPRPLVRDYVPAEENPLYVDWITIALGLLALIAVGGLIPFYLWVYFLFF
jgi:hypothetical protein